MLTFFFGAFGLSTLWFLRPIWRLLRLLLARQRPLPSDKRALRFWSGVLLMLVASATLEGLVVAHYTDDPAAGGAISRLLARGFGGLLGVRPTSLLMLAVLCAALPWYLELPWRSLLGSVARSVDGLGELLFAGFLRLGLGRTTGRGRPGGGARRSHQVSARRRAVQQPAPARKPAATAAIAPRRTTAPPVPSIPASPMNPLAANRPGMLVTPAQKIIREPWLLPRSARPSTAPARGAAAVRIPAVPPPSTDAIAPSRTPAAASAVTPAPPSMPSRTDEKRETLGVTVPAAMDSRAAGEPSHPSSPVASDIGPFAEAGDDAAIMHVPIIHGEDEAVACRKDETATEDDDLAIDPAVLWPRATAIVLPSHRLAANDDSAATPIAPDMARPAPVPVAAVTEPSPATATTMPAQPPRSQPAVRLPPLNLLAAATTTSSTAVDEAQLAQTGELIEQRLREFKVPVAVVGASAGPVITRFEVEPAVGVRGSQIVALMKDLARGLGRTSIRVVETIPGRTCMGLELPNEQRQMIALSEILDSPEYRDSDSLLTLAMGKGITGEPVVADLAKAPHMLVAGTTGSGKSVAVNAMILSLLYKATPEDVRLIMIDPKMLELSVYEGIPHLLAPVVTDMKLAANALAWCVGEMESRYRLMSDLHVRNLAGFNHKVREARAMGRPLLNPFPAHPEVPEHLDTLPMIVVVIDELADLMMVAGKKIEELIARLAQKARAAGIHLILATQRPSVDVITGLIKANIPTRVAFQVSSKIDSRTILDQMGAESLLGQGDMLFLPPGTGYPQRVHGAFVADEEVHRVVAHLKQYGEPDYKDEILAGPLGENGSGDLLGEEGVDAELDPLYDEAAAFVLRSRRASISFVQRQFRIGYNRAARLVEAMEAAGLVSSMGINGQREVIAPGPVE